jgi:hypothetical protein
LGFRVWCAEFTVWGVGLASLGLELRLKVLGRPATSEQVGDVAPHRRARPVWPILAVLRLRVKVKV